MMMEIAEIQTMSPNRLISWFMMGSYAYYDLGIRDFQQIADNFGIKAYSVETYYDRAMDKLLEMEFEL